MTSQHVSAWRSSLDIIFDPAAFLMDVEACDESVARLPHNEGIVCTASRPRTDDDFCDGLLWSIEQHGNSRSISSRLVLYHRDIEPQPNVGLIAADNVREKAPDPRRKGAVIELVPGIEIEEPLKGLTCLRLISLSKVYGTDTSYRLESLLRRSCLRVAHGLKGLERAVVIEGAHQAPPSLKLVTDLSRDVERHEHHSDHDGWNSAEFH
jgi:hypothetical protein